MHHSLLGAAIALVSAAHPARAQAAAMWPTDREAQLKRLDAELLECQRQRFAALFAKDEASVPRLDERFAELQKKRRELLDGPGGPL
jgi:hypothetical protein